MTNELEVIWKEGVRVKVKVGGKALPVTSHAGPYGCKPSRLSHFLDNWLTDGSEVVNLTRRPPFTSMKIPSTHFC
jgi:hypothetical protein